jgi:cyclase
MKTPTLISEIATVFGSQAIVVSIDVRQQDGDSWEVFIDDGRTATGRDPVSWAHEVESRGAGEILIQDIGRDGAGTGYDVALIRAVAAATRLPVIACAGVGRYEHFVDGVRAGASAVAAANIWHFKELVDLGAKRTMAKAGINVRL